MELGENIARNAALRENVFMMAVCVELRIPLFVVGKPGSSKSLAKSIIAESMKGQNSKKDFLKNFKTVSLAYNWVPISYFTLCRQTFKTDKCSVKLVLLFCDCIGEAHFLSVQSTVHS